MEDFKVYMQEQLVRKANQKDAILVSKQYEHYYTIIMLVGIVR